MPACPAGTGRELQRRRHAARLPGQPADRNRPAGGAAATLFTTADDSWRARHASGNGPNSRWNIELAAAGALGNADVGDRISCGSSSQKRLGPAKSRPSPIRTGPGKRARRARPRPGQPDPGARRTTRPATTTGRVATYPQDAVFSAGSFDILNFQVGYDGETSSSSSLAGPVDNRGAAAAASPSRPSTSTSTRGTAAGGPCCPAATWL